MGEVDRAFGVDFNEELFPAIRYIFYVSLKNETQKDAATIGARALIFKRIFSGNYYLGIVLLFILLKATCFLIYLRFLNYRYMILKKLLAHVVWWRHWKQP